MSPDVTRTWAGNPSRIATREGPWDSPAVSQRSMVTVFHDRSGADSPSPRHETGPDRFTDGHADQPPDQEERAERVRDPEHAAVAAQERDQQPGEGERQERAVHADDQLRPADVPE